MSRRATVSESEIARVTDLLKELGIRIAKVDIEPGKVSITVADGGQFILPDRVADLERQKEKWDTPHGRRKPISAN